MAGNLFPYRWVNVETDPEAEKLPQLYEFTKADLPAVLTGDGMALKRPTISELGETVGLSPKASQSLYDLAIIGAGPAGLAAAVYGGSEGLRTIMIDKRGPGFGPLCRLQKGLETGSGAVFTRNV